MQEPVYIIVGGKRYEYRNGVLHMSAQPEEYHQHRPVILPLPPDWSDLYAGPVRRQPTRQDRIRLAVSVALFVILVAVILVALPQMTP